MQDGAQYVTKAVLVVAGVREDGCREILGARVTECENEELWSGVFEDLTERGLTGIQKAASAAFLGGSGRCVQSTVPGQY
jgi:putative transposase